MILKKKKKTEKTGVYDKIQVKYIAIDCYEYFLQFQFIAKC